MVKNIPSSRMMTPNQVAEAFGVNAKTITRWAQTGRLHCVRTLGGHRRFDREQIETLLANSEEGTESI